LLVAGTLVRVSVVDVAPATFVNVVPPSVLTACQREFTFNRFDQHNRDLCERERERETDASSSIPCHCTVGLGDPDADAVNVAVLPAVTVVELGFVVTDGGPCTVSVADVLVADPAAFMNTA